MHPVSSHVRRGPYGHENEPKRDSTAQIAVIDDKAAPGRAGLPLAAAGYPGLYAALNLHSGEVLGSLHQRHRVPAGLEVHLVLDNAEPQDPDGQALAGSAPPLPSALHPDLQQLDQPRRALVRRAHDQAPAPRASIAPSARSTPTSATGSTPGPRTPDPTSGPRPPIKSSTRSNATANELTGRDARHSPGISDRWHSGSSI